MLEPSTKVVPLVFNECDKSFFELTGVPEAINFLAGECEELSYSIDLVDSFFYIISYVN